EERDRLLEPVLADQISSDAGEAARNQIAAVCSTYQSSAYTGWHEAITYLDEEDDTTHFTSIADLPGTWSGSVLACPADWGGDLGAVIASHAGIAAPPSRSGAEPAVTDDVRIALATWLLGFSGAEVPNDLVWHPGTAVGVDTRTAPTASDRTLTHLTQITSGYPHRQTGLLVVGDTADDFALARLWRLTFGAAYWLPSALGSMQEHVPWPISLRVKSLARELARSGGSLALTSTSLSGQQLVETRERFSAANPIIQPPAKDKDALQVLEDGDLLWNQNATVGYAVQGQWDTITTIPVTLDDTSTASMAAPMPPPVLTHPDLAHQANLAWHVDVSWRPGRTVRRRGLDSLQLFAEQPTMMPTWTRSSRDGITYQSQRFDFVAAGIRPENRLASVALRDLSLEAWIKAKGLEHGLEARPSEAGRRAMLLAKMLGGRQAFLDLFGGPLLPALRAMLTTSSTTSTVYPDHQGVALSSSEGVLTFAGLCARSPDLPEDDVRERLDAAARAGVVRRGLVLRCATCEQTQFMPLDKLRQRWRCQRCDASNDLDLWAWKAPANEPMWFYDLHPVARHLLAENGDVPALLSRHLFNHKSDPRSQFDDVAEVVFTKDSTPQVEVDLVTYIDDTITVAECKIAGDDVTGKKGRNEVSKKCHAAAWLRADTLVFATKADRWTDNSRTTISSTVRNFSGWGPLGAPKVVLTSGLGTAKIRSEVL
ncbi:MAG TPA: hypothetical protein VM347_42505, partial [Nonomuraea sp.]|nr:hypothetical protein [Nonomuraea sp.]